MYAYLYLTILDLLCSVYSYGPKIRSDSVIRLLTVCLSPSKKKAKQRSLIFAELGRPFSLDHRIPIMAYIAASFFEVVNLYCVLIPVETTRKHYSLEAMEALAHLHKS